MTHLAEYLQYYNSLSEPGYAVLVTGAWGVGKTCQVKGIISEDQRVYVSLYGLSSIDQIHAEVFAAAHPISAKSKSAFSMLKDKTIGAAGVTIPLGFVPEIIGAFARNEIKPDRLLIFDDLERTKLSLTEVLGAINSYVEQKKFRVVVIAHDDEVLNDNFGRMKEKTFGQTIQVEPQVDEALDDFLNNLKSCQAKEFIVHHKDLIVELFFASGVKSLRVLKHVIEDLARLHDLLSSRHRNNSAAMIDLVSNFAALDLEVRAGRFTKAEIRSISDPYLNYFHSRDENNQEPNVVSEAYEKFPSVKFDSKILNDETLVMMLVEGSYPSEEIRKSLDNSPHFITEEQTLPWKIVINFDELEDEVVERAYRLMEQQFVDREVTNLGEMLHIFSLRMMMAENGIINRDVKEVAAENKKYIDDLLCDHKLSAASPEEVMMHDFASSYDGYGYWVSQSNKKLFDEVFDYLKLCRERAFEEALPKIHTKILRMIREEPTEFFEYVSQTNNGANPYANIPILNGIDHKEFVSTWLEVEGNKRSTIRSALENRYSHNRLFGDLRVEFDWAIEIFEELKSRSKAKDGFESLRIRRLIPRAFNELHKIAQQLKSEDETGNEAQL